MTYIMRHLVQSALVIPDMPTWGGQLLGPGSIIDVDTELSPSPLGCDEVAIRWIDVAGRELGGWIAQTQIVRPVVSLRTATLTNVREDLRIGPLDWLRDKCRTQQLKEPKNGWTFARWLHIFGEAHYTVLKAAARELGAFPRDLSTADELTRRVLRLAINQEPHMSDTATIEAPAKAKTRKAVKASDVATSPMKERTAKKAKAEAVVEAPAKKARKADEEVAGRAPASQTLGETLVKLLKKGGAGLEAAQEIAGKMAAGKTPTSKQLLTLRDAINTAAGTAREKEKTDLATELSNANRLVRRLARAAAAE